VLGAGVLFYGALLVIGLLTIGLQEATGEVLPRYEALHWPHLPDLASGLRGRRTDQLRAWFRQSRRRQQLLTFVITGQPEAVSKRVLDEMRRGVTGLSGVGMYTGHPRTVLMCALTVTEAAHLKALVAETDPNAIVIVASAQEVLGVGFRPLNDTGRA
jgi:hypothetical protein